MWVISGLFCGSVGQTGRQVQPTFNPASQLAMYLNWQLQLASQLLCIYQTTCRNSVILLQLHVFNQQLKHPKGTQLAICVVFRSYNCLTEVLARTNVSTSQLQVVQRTWNSVISCSAKCCGACLCLVCQSPSPQTAWKEGQQYGSAASPDCKGISYSQLATLNYVSTFAKDLFLIFSPLDFISSLPLQLANYVAVYLSLNISQLASYSCVASQQKVSYLIFIRV